jgi:hypothetical protein
MTGDKYSDISVSTPGEFEAALAAVVEAAVIDDIDVRGAWEFQTRGSAHNWEVEISELAKRLDAEDDEADDD